MYVTVSSRAATAIYNAGLFDLGILTECNKLDHSKLNRQISKIGQQLCDQQMMELTQCICIAFDERIDESKALVKDEIILDHDQKSINSPSFTIQKIIKEEHVPILSETASRYIVHLSPIDGKALTLAKDFLNILAESSSRDSLKAICCDGCSKNTGAKGVIAIIENELGRALQYKASVSWTLASAPPPACQYLYRIIWSLLHYYLIISVSLIFYLREMSFYSELGM